MSRFTWITKLKILLSDKFCGRKKSQTHVSWFENLPGRMTGLVNR